MNKVQTKSGTVHYGEVQGRSNTEKGKKVLSTCGPVSKGVDGKKVPASTPITCKKCAKK